VIYRFSTTDERELSTLDLTSGQDDRHGGVLIRLELWRTESDPVPGKPGLYAWGKRFRKVLAKPLVMQFRIDMSGLHALATKAARSRSGKAKGGPVTVRGGGAAVWTREEIPE